MFSVLLFTRPVWSCEFAFALAIIARYQFIGYMCICCKNSVKICSTILYINRKIILRTKVKCQPIAWGRGEEGGGILTGTRNLMLLLTYTTHGTHETVYVGVSIAKETLASFVHDLYAFFWSCNLFPFFYLYFQSFPAIMIFTNMPPGPVSWNWAQIVWCRPFVSTFIMSCIF